MAVAAEVVEAAEGVEAAEVVEAAEAAEGVEAAEVEGVEGVVGVLWVGLVLRHHHRCYNCRVLVAGCRIVWLRYAHVLGVDARCGPFVVPLIGV
ncbi:MAG: hypothetical protein ACR2PR_02765 [Pseudohongiellaceae bacterium]